MFSFLALKQQKRKVYKHEHPRITMSLTSKVKSAWNSTIKPIISSPWSYVTLAAFSFGALANAQVQNPQDANLHGKVTSGLTTQGIPQAEVKYISANPQTVLTNSFGEYLFNITDVEDEQNTQTQETIKFYTNRLDVTIKDAKEFRLYNSLGELVETQEIQSNTTITPQLNNLASGVYFTDIITENGTLYRNKIAVQEKQILGAGLQTTKVDNTSQSLNKSLEDITYTLEFRDLTEQHYPYIISQFDPQTLQQNQEYSTPLLPKKNLDIPFTNPRNNMQVNNTRDLLFFEAGVDYLIYSAYQPLARPLLIHLNTQDLPTQYSEQDVRNATLEMLTATNLPVDTSLWQETENYIPPLQANSSTIGYNFLDSSVMGQDEMSITYRKDAQKQITSLQFYFNKDLIESNQIGSFIKQAWFMGIVQGNVPAEGYFSNDPRDSLNSIVPGSDENIVYSNLIQYEDRPTWISDENIPENNLAKLSNNITKEELSQKLLEQSKSYSISFKRNRSVTKKYIIK